MWEWEDQDDDGIVTDQAVNNMNQLVESQRLELERRQELKKIELEINQAIDSRIAKFKNLMEVSRLEVQKIGQHFSKQQEVTREVDRLRELNERLIAQQAEIEQMDSGPEKAKAESQLKEQIIQNNQALQAQEKIAKKITDEFKARTRQHIEAADVSDKLRKKFEEALNAEELDEGRINSY